MKNSIITIFIYNMRFSFTIKSWCDSRVTIDGVDYIKCRPNNDETLLLVRADSDSWRLVKGNRNGETEETKCNNDICESE